MLKRTVFTAACFLLATPVAHAASLVTAVPPSPDTSARSVDVMGVRLCFGQSEPGLLCDVRVPDPRSGTEAPLATATDGSWWWGELRRLVDTIGGGDDTNASEEASNVG